MQVLRVVAACGEQSLYSKFAIPFADTHTHTHNDMLLRGCELSIRVTNEIHGMVCKNRVYTQAIRLVAAAGELAPFCNFATSFRKADKESDTHTGTNATAHEQKHSTKSKYRNPQRTSRTPTHHHK